MASEERWHHFIYIFIVIFFFHLTKITFFTFGIFSSVIFQMFHPKTIWQTNRFESTGFNQIFIYRLENFDKKKF